MIRKILQAGVFAALGLIATMATYGAAASADDKSDKLPTIKEIMDKGHKGSDAYLAKIKGDAKDGKWDEAKDYAKTLVVFGEALGKNKPPKGEDASWEKLTKKYAESTKAVLKAVEAKDAAATTKALGSINCGECHKAHK